MCRWNIRNTSWNLWFSAMRETKLYRVCRETIQDWRLMEATIRERRRET